MEPISRDDSGAPGKSGRSKKARRRKISIAAAVVVVLAIGTAAVVSNGGGSSSRSGSLYDDAITTTCDRSTDGINSIAKVVWTSSLNTGIVRVRFNFTGNDGPTSPDGNAVTVNGNKVFSASYDFGAKSVKVEMYDSTNTIRRESAAQC